MSFLSDLARSLPRLRTSQSESDRVLYARDLWPRQHLAVRSGNVAANKAAAIVWPETTEEVAHIVAAARRSKTPLVPFGAGSGVCGGVLPSPETIVVDLKRMRRTRALDREAHTVTVEAGAMGLPFEESLVTAGFTLGHFPSSIVCSTVGGWVAGRSAGQCSSLYGKIEDMVLDVECVLGTGEVVTLKYGDDGASLVPLMVGSEGTLGIITATTLRLHPAPTERVFASYTFPSTEAGFVALRNLMQAGLRPAVARLYDPFDAMLARRGSVRKESDDDTSDGATRAGAQGKSHAPGMGATFLRTALKQARTVNGLIDKLGATAFGPALLVLVFEGPDGGAVRDESERARKVLLAKGGTESGEGPARKWFEHRYTVSYRQAPVFEGGLFSDTFEVAAPWSRLGDLYDGVRKALGANAFVMSHFSHAYPDGCCIYFSFAGTSGDSAGGGWDAGCEERYDRTWRSALAAAVEAGGTIAHHHGVGRSKAPLLSRELPGVIETFRILKRVFDPDGILNPGNLEASEATFTSRTRDYL